MLSNTNLPGNNMINIEDAFEKYDDEYLEFKNVKDKLHSRPDICAFLLLDKLVPGKENIVSGASHDEIYLSIDCDELAKVASEDDILMLTRCGVRFEDDGLCMWA